MRVSVGVEAGKKRGLFVSVGRRVVWITKSIYFLLSS